MNRAAFPRWSRGHGFNQGPVAIYFPFEKRSEPLAIQRPAGIRIRNAVFDDVQVVGIGWTDPENSASPRGLSVTNGVLMASVRPARIAEERTHDLIDGPRRSDRVAPC